VRKTKKNQKKTEIEKSSYWKQIKELYEKAKEKGEDVPGDMAEWVKQDIKKIGTWEYKIVTISSSDSEKIEKQLNELGKERWECYWIQKQDQDQVFFFKRTGRSYLRFVPGRELLKIATPGD